MILKLEGQREEIGIVRTWKLRGALWKCGSDLGGGGATPQLLEPQELRGGPSEAVPTPVGAEEGLLSFGGSSGVWRKSLVLLGLPL